MKKQFLNSATSLLLQFVTIIVGLILPRIVIQTFGSSVNGLVNSITQFISYITLFEAGLGGVVRAAIYKPLVHGDYGKISSILKSTEQYFRRLAIFFVFYVLVLAAIYPVFINTTFGFSYTASLVLIVAISTFAQYFIGITYSIFLQADAKNYITNTVQILTLISNAVLMVTFIFLGASIHQVRLISAIVYVVKPVALMIYVRIKYPLAKKCDPDMSALSQRKNGMAHHIAWFLHTNTDIVVLSFFGDLNLISVYSVYYMIISSMTKIATALVSGVEALFGKKIAGSSDEKVRNDFELFCMVLNSIVIVLFFTAGAMLIPFVKLYTRDITDASYVVPAFGYVLLLSELVYCLRIPYHGIVTAAGHFKETKTSAIVEAAINIVFSVVFIHLWGLLGIALATFGSMIFRTVYYIYYLSKSILKIEKAKHFLRNITCILLISIAVTAKIMFWGNRAETYGVWVQQSIICGICGVLMAGLYDLLFFKKELFSLVKISKRKVSQ